MILEHVHLSKKQILTYKKYSVVTAPRILDLKHLLRMATGSLIAESVH